MLRYQPIDATYYVTICAIIVHILHIIVDYTSWRVTMVRAKPVALPVNRTQGWPYPAQAQARRLSHVVGRQVWFAALALVALWLSMAGWCRPAMAQALNNVVRPASNANASVFTPTGRAGVGLHRHDPQRLEPAAM